MLKSLFNKVATLLKGDSNTGVFLWNLGNFLEHLLPVATSVQCRIEIIALNVLKTNDFVGNNFADKNFWKTDEQVVQFLSMKITLQ